MSWLKPLALLWKQPRRTMLRRLLFLFHLYAGLILGFIITIVSLTGSLIIYKPEIEKAMISEISEVIPLKKTVSLDTLYALVQAHRPGDNLQSVAMYGGKTAAWNFRCVPAGGGRVQVYVDQYRGRILGQEDFSNSIFQWIYDLHADLLGGKNGRVVNGIIGLLFAVICLSGLVIWWPGAARIKKVLAIIEMLPGKASTTICTNCLDYIVRCCWF